MRPAIRWPDGRYGVRDLLREFLATREEPEAAGVTVSTRSYPGSDADPLLPYVRLRTDQTFRSARLDGRETVRVQVFHRDETQAQDLALLVEAFLLSPAARNAEVRGITSIHGPIPIDDSSANAPESFLTVTVRLRPSVLI
jgi:hypothetical protein